MMIVISGLIGLFGFLAMTWLFPIISKFYAHRTNARRATTNQRAPLSKIAILIPAHNEELTLPKTLPAIVACKEHLQKHYPNIQVDIRIGADGCTDRTIEIAQSFGAEVFENNPSQGKWKTVYRMIQASQDADWIALADSGILWPENFLSACVSYAEQNDVIGIAPTYRNPSAGWVEKIIWGLEARLKSIENTAGGPISVHGPTVLYRQKDLRAAFDALTASGTTWINDDVAISLWLRLHRPEGRVVYVTSVGSWDCPESHIDSRTGTHIREFNRRKRMVLGNIQWMTQILAPAWRRNDLAALIALRRIFRMLWAYWVLALTLTAALVLGFGYFSVLAVITGTLGVLVLGTRPLQMLLDAGFVSLSAPYYWATGQGLSRWK